MGFAFSWQVPFAVLGAVPANVKASSTVSEIPTYAPVPPVSRYRATMLYTEGTRMHELGLLSHD